MWSVLIEVGKDRRVGNFWKKLLQVFNIFTNFIKEMFMKTVRKKTNKNFSLLKCLKVSRKSFKFDCVSKNSKFKSSLFFIFPTLVIISPQRKNKTQDWTYLLTCSYSLARLFCFKLLKQLKAKLIHALFLQVFDFGNWNKRKKRFMITRKTCCCRSSLARKKGNRCGLFSMRVQQQLIINS